MTVDAASRPGFCSVCYCEKCHRGFYTAIKGAVKLRSGQYVCSEPGCPGVVKDKPTLSFQRVTPCKDNCKRLKVPA